MPKWVVVDAEVVGVMDVVRLVVDVLMVGCGLPCLCLGDLVLAVPVLRVVMLGQVVMPLRVVQGSKLPQYEGRVVVITDTVANQL